MTIERYYAKLREHGYTVFLDRESYLILQGREGDRPGIPKPETLTPEAREEEMERFLKCYVL